MVQAAAKGDDKKMMGRIDKATAQLTERRRSGARAAAAAIGSGDGRTTRRRFFFLPWGGEGHGASCGERAFAAKDILCKPSKDIL